MEKLGWDRIPFFYHGRPEDKADHQQTTCYQSLPCKKTQQQQYAYYEFGNRQCVTEWFYQYIRQHRFSNFPSIHELKPFNLGSLIRPCPNMLMPTASRARRKGH
jgi:hypothetical protein